MEETYDFDYHGSLAFMKIHFDSISTAMKEGVYVQEDAKTRTPKERDMDRVVILIENILEDNFADRCGYDDDFEVVLMDGDDDYIKSESTITDDQRENNTKAIEKAIILEEKEWKEFIKLLKNMKTWWI